jgi:3D (Asp-Asp-Asp) domain-containing protein
LKALFILLLFALLLVNPTECEPATYVEPVVIEQAESLGEHVITAYCPCVKCCGEWALKRKDGIVEVNGVVLQEGVSVAAPYPAGTILDIEGIGVRVVHDSTADWIVDKYDSKVVDVYFDDHEEASRFGKHVRDVTIVSRGGSR